MIRPFDTIKEAGNGRNTEGNVRETVVRYDIWNLGSSSEGNCFIVKHKDCKEALILECGLHVNQFNKRRFELHAPLDYIVLISHEHGDHSRMQRSLEYLYHFYASNGTAEAMGDKNENIRRLKIQQWQPAAIINAAYEVFPLKATHDAAEPLMYLIRPVGIDEILFFVIDTAEIPYDLHQFNITDALIECNYSESDISPDMDPIRMERVRRSHMSLETLTEFFGNQKFPNLQQITLCHLSQSNCDPKKAKETNHGGNRCSGASLCCERRFYWQLTNDNQRSCRRFRSIEKLWNIVKSRTTGRKESSILLSRQTKEKDVLFSSGADTHAKRLQHLSLISNQ